MRLLIIGENPGSPEEQETPPQEWPIFRVLDSWLFRAGWKRGEVFTLPYVNVYPTYLPDGFGGYRTPTRDEVYEQAHLVDEVIREVEPEGAITLGVLATWAMVPNVRHFMEKDGGSQYRCVRAGHTFPVIPFPHPSERNRIFLEPAGSEAVARGIETLSRLKARVEAYN